MGVPAGEDRDPFGAAFVEALRLDERDDAGGRVGLLVAASGAGLEDAAVVGADVGALRLVDHRAGGRVRVASGRGRGLGGWDVARLPLGPVWGDPFIRAQLLAGCREIEQIARAEGVPVAPDIIDRISAYLDGIPGTMRSSLLIDLSSGKRTEVEALHGSVVRRAERASVAVPIMSTLYALLKPWAHPRA